MNPRNQRIAAVAAILVAVLGTFAWQATTHASVTFASVAQGVQKANSATFVVTITGVGPAPLIIKVSVLGNRVRQEPAQGPVEISEPAQSKSLALLPDHKALLTTTTGVPPREVEDFAQNCLFLLKQRLIEAAGKAEDAGQKQINGRTAKGFLVKDGTRKLTVWADAASGAILRVDWPLQDRVSVVVEDIRLGVDLDEALFSLVPPKSYTLLQMNLANPNEQDLLYYLRVSAESRGGVFPQRIWEGPREQAMVSPDWPEEKVWEFRQNVLRGKIFREMAGNRYAGAGVRLGEADKPIFWYRPPNASMYHVIYGDLSVREVSPDSLPSQASTLPVK